jgi:replicative DNA helicase
MKHKNTPKKAVPVPEELDSRFVPAGELGVEVMQFLEKAYTEHPGLYAQGILPGALTPGKVSVIASHPSMGKTALLVNLGMAMRKKGLNVAVYLPSGTPEDFAFKTICAESRVNLGAARRGQLRREKWVDLTRAAGQFADACFFFERRQPVTLEAISDSVSTLSQFLEQDGKHLDAVFIDSLNHLKPEEESYGLVEGPRGLARRFNLPVIATYCLGSFKDKAGPGLTLGDLRLLGLDEAVADHLFYLFREEFWDREDPTLRGMATLRRLYPCLAQSHGDLMLRFDSPTLRFSIPHLPGLEDAPEQELFKI